MAYRKITATSTLPKIVRFLGITDYGPCDGGEPTAVCPHCGSGGRYVHAFECADGTRRGAMSGCVQLFPISLIATEDQKLTERELDLKKRFGKDAQLNSWDKNIQAIIHRFYAGALTEPEALRLITNENRAKQVYRRNRFRGGR